MLQVARFGLLSYELRANNPPKQEFLKLPLHPQPHAESLILGNLGEYFTMMILHSYCVSKDSVEGLLLAAKAGATFVSPFIGRLDEIGQEGMQIDHAFCRTSPDECVG